MLPWYPIIQIPHIYIITVIGETEHPYQNTYSAPTVNILGGIIMTRTDKFNRGTFSSKHAFISNNKLDVVLERYPNIKGTEIESLIRTLVSVIVEAERHQAEGDTFFDYVNDKFSAEARVNLMITMIYRNDGNIDKIEKDICYKNGKVEATELSDHYWAFCK